MRVAVVENTRISNLGQVGVALAEAGADITVFQPWKGGDLPAFDSHDALVVLGGEQNAMADDTHPYLPELAGLMRTFGDAGKAVLGICLGSQILARGYGADNHIGKAPEFGWQRIAPTPEGAADPLLSATGGEFPIFQWHDDTFDLPDGAIHLATNPATRNQAFRVGRAAYGTQFHFEANTDVVEEWKANFPEIIERKEQGWLNRYPEIAAANAPAANAAGLAIARAWVGLIESGQPLHGGTTLGA